MGDTEYYFLLSLILLFPLLYSILNRYKNITATATATATASSKEKEKIRPFPPGPIPWPLIGNILQISGKMPHVALADLAQIHGPIILLQLGTQYMVVGSSPTAATQILKTHDRLLSARYVPKVLLSNTQEELNNKFSIGWTDTCNDGWKYLRTLCRTELFSGKILDDQSCLREKKIHEMIEHLNKCKNHVVVDVGEVVFVTVFNMLSNVLLSKDLIGFDENGMKDLVRKLMEISSAPNLSDLYPVLSPFDPQGLRRKTTKLVKKIQEIWEPIIEGRRKKLREFKNDFLDVLLHNNFSNAQIYHLLMELFNAGTDTSTSTIEWAMAELIRNQESLKIVRGELDREFGANSTIKDYSSCSLLALPYLNACVKETLRLHPPAPLLLPHRAPETCQLMSYTIPKDARVLVNVWAIGRDPSLWDEPLTFKPERFLNSARHFKGNHFEFLPFGAGRRICPALPMAERQLHSILAAMLHSFDWSLPEGNDPQQLDMKEKFGITLEKEQPLLLIATPRK